jgi:copper chaperone CopZ
MMVDQFLVPDMTDSRAAGALQAALQGVPGVHMVVVDITTRAVRITHDERVGVSALIDAIRRAGYRQVSVLA